MPVSMDGGAGSARNVEEATPRSLANSECIGRAAEAGEEVRERDARWNCVI